MSKSPGSPPLDERTISLRAIPFLQGSVSGLNPPLGDKQRRALASICTRVRVPARMTLYHEQSQAKWVFMNASGTVKTFRDLPSGKRRINAFLFPGDLFGLAERGKYVNAAQAITAVTLYRVPLDSLAAVLRQDADLQFSFLCKVTHELREAQRRAMIVSRRDAAGRLAMFLQMIREQLYGEGRPQAIPLAMSRSDIADFLSLSLEAVSRAAAELERRGVVRFEARHLVRVLNEKRLDNLALDA